MLNVTLIQHFSDRQFKGATQEDLWNYLTIQVTFFACLEKRSDFVFALIVKKLPKKSQRNGLH